MTVPHSASVVGVVNALSIKVVVFPSLPLCCLVAVRGLRFGRGQLSEQILLYNQDGPLKLYYGMASLIANASP